MSYNLHLYQRLTGSDAYLGNLTAGARGWRRTIRAIGGYWLGSFSLVEGDGMTWEDLRTFYDNFLGNRLVETTYGSVSWEGLLYEFRLARRGREYRRTLSPDWWHTKVKTLYSYPTMSDDEQGNLTYNPVANSFQDDGQAFNEWQTVAGDAVYLISVTNSDDTTAWGFLGAAFTTTNANDSIYIYTDAELATAGWNGETSGKTPSSYDVRHATLAGSRQETSWSENTDASDEYGDMQYIVSLAGATPESAEAARDTELEELAWPRSRKMGGGAAGTGALQDAATLNVTVAGYWATLNWRYREQSRTATGSSLVETLIGESQFVTAGRIEDNDLAMKADCDPVPQRLGDLLEGLILLGDIYRNPWQGGVYAGRKFVYEPTPTTVAHYELSDGTLVDAAQRPVVPSAMEAGFLLKDQSAPAGGQPPGSSSVWDDPCVAYVEEVEFVAPDVLNYRLSGEEESVAVMMQQIRRGLYKECWLWRHEEW